MLNSGELVTEFTIPAENRTEQLSDVAIDSSITRQTQGLNLLCKMEEERASMKAHRLVRFCIFPGKVATGTVTVARKSDKFVK